MSVRGAIRNTMELRKNAKTYMTNANGRPLSRDQAVSALMDELSKGHEVIPLSDCCGNPCKNAHLGCTGFLYKQNDDGKSGCPGYPTPAAEVTP
jgi:hypothetical protein